MTIERSIGYKVSETTGKYIQCKKIGTKFSTLREDLTSETGHFPTPILA
jgi:hypothetical protein